MTHEQLQKPKCTAHLSNSWHTRCHIIPGRMKTAQHATVCTRFGYSTEVYSYIPARIAHTLNNSHCCQSMYVDDHITFATIT